MAFNSTPQDIIDQNINGLLDVHNSWKRVPLALVCNVKNGFAFKSTSFNSQGEGERLIRIRDVLPGDTKTYYSGSVPDGYWVNLDDIIVGMDGDFNIAWWPSEPALLNQRVCRLDITSHNYLKRFFYRALPGYIEAVNLNTSSTTVKHLSSKTLNDLLIPLPPLAEQKAIADKLDTLLAQVENTKARLERIPQILKRFRQSVLAAAVSGRLTEEWRKDKQLNAPEQLQAIRTRYPSKPAKEGLAKFHELPQTWDWALVKEVGDVQLGRQRAPKYHQGTNMRPYLRVANVMEGYIDTRDIMEMEFNEKDYERYRLSEGDILLNEGQSHELVGRPAMFKGEVEGACFTNTLVRFRPRPGVSGNFAYMVFLSYLQSGRFQQIASRTVNISHLGAGRFADMEFPFPTLEEQTEIVRRVDQLFAHADRIEQQINNSLTRVNNLTQSILAKAFRGELTEQWRKDNPELISGDNSAEALLERIKAEQAAAKPAKKIRKKMSS